ncbi:hypothetical protein IMCC20628_04880 (plasmid) [Hoeflea sp. IMCC20628]|uniref:hypothetical protein n=1 Tax=Hoeflea sp. IMCC20628 TaxID=1620421 RepID=UPI00063BE2A4|nr:hypothetical protein [Hoeflea sp. IMCC20628]AKI03544.1 hypothetical protein IMCC20628_04880 [Hoeflea sp. IMCC20628]
MFISEPRHFIEAFNAAAIAGNIGSWTYGGRLLLPGNDASIMVKKSAIIVTIDNVPAPNDHPINEFVADNEDEIREVTAEDLGSHREIIIAGRWHDNGNETQSFEPYLIHKISSDGSARSAKYDYAFYGIGGYRFGLDLHPGVDGECAFGTMKAATADHTDYSHLRPGLAESVGLPTGVVWYPVIPSALPFLVVEHANKIFERRSA